MLQAPEPDDGLFPGALGYWCALLHLLVYGFGWSRPDRGLHWWYGAEKPVDDPKLALISEIWDADGQLDWFAAWLWTMHPHDYLRPTTDTRDGIRIDVDPGWLDYVDHQARATRTPSPYGADGGSDPLHLSMHIDGPLQEPRALREEISFGRSGNRRAVLTTNTMTGWYQALLDADPLPGDDAGKAWQVDVIVRPVGWIGTFRRSRSTGLWYTGKHRHHLVGN